MGWNNGYTILEATVVGVYDLGKLDKELLTVLLEPYRNTDIDSGGSRDLRSKDRKTFEEIVIETWGLEMPKKPRQSRSKAPDYWYTYDEAVSVQMQVIREHFGW